MPFTEAEASIPTESLHDLVVRSARSVTRVLAIIVPLLCAASVATGEATLEATLWYLAVFETAFVALWWVARGRAAERWPDLILFAGTLLASGGVIFSAAHVHLGYKPYALLAPMTSLTFASMAPVRPRLSYALAAGTTALYVLSLWLVPADRAVDPFGFAAMCFSMAWLGATVARDQLRLWSHLDDARNRALESVRVKAEFLANMSHEIRTPMTAILGFAEEVEIELEASPVNSRIRSALSTVRRNGAHLLALINGILDLSKIEAGKFEVARERVSPIQTIAAVKSLLGAQASEKGVALEAVAVGPVPEEIETDGTRLRQILINLVGNAIKFTDAGRVRIEVGLVEDELATATLLEIAIADSGCGISAEQLQRVFETFTQVQGSAAREHQGTGLGLGLSRKLARLLGGDVRAQSELGRGSRFSLRIPCGSLAGVRILPASDVGEFAVIDRPYALRTPADLTGRVLLVEDGPDNQRLIGSVLRRAGLVVEIAANGELGCELALFSLVSDDPYDIILMDMQMPVLDGYAAVKRLRASGYRHPIIALTAQAMAGDRERCIAVGCDDYASKPIHRESLLQQVARFLRKPE